MKSKAKSSKLNTKYKIRITKYELELKEKQTNE